MEKKYDVLRSKISKVAINVNRKDRNKYVVLVSDKDYGILDSVVLDPSKGHQVYGVEILIGKTKKPKLVTKIKTNR